MSISSSTSRCCKFSIKEIKEATNQFDGSKILGQGGEAKVYYAEIYIGSNKTPVAVKHLKENSKEFEREIYTLSKIHHPNLVSLIGYCDESGHKILVYEYMAKGCLSDYLKKKSSVSLSWLQRLNICLGAARGLQHLHTETDEFPKGIIHRDVKPGNILVGENWVGKLSDFGMFKLSNAGQDKSLMTTNLKGTSGYYAPEYIKYRRITRKIDVYAFGVVLFEVLCRKMPWDRGDESYYADEDEDLGFWAKQNVDALIQGEITGDSLAVFTDIIGRSLQANPIRRPTIDGVLLDLQKALECQESVYLAKQLEGSSRKITDFGNRVDTRLKTDLDKLVALKPSSIPSEKCPPEGKDKVVLYTRFGDSFNTKEAQDSLKLKKILEDQNVDFEERNLKKVPRFKNEVTLPCPKLFVKGKYVGGLEEVQGWNKNQLESAFLNFKLKEENRYLPCGEDTVVIYTSDKKGPNSQFVKDSQEVIKILTEQKIHFENRNEHGSANVKKELKILGTMFEFIKSHDGAVKYPIIFARGKHIGGLEKVKDLQKKGELKSTLLNLKK